MSEYITGFETAEGVKQYDYNALGNLPKIPDVGICGNALKGFARGAAVRVDDVSPLEHTAKALVHGKNLLNISSLLNSTLVENGDGTYTMTKNGNARFSEEISLVEPISLGTVVTVSAGSVQGTASYISVQLLSANREKTYELNLNQTTLSRTKTLEFEAARIRLYISSSETDGDYVTFKNLQFEVGDTPTGYVPYLDPSTVTVTRYGKNLIDLSKAIFNGCVATGNGVQASITDRYYIELGLHYLIDFVQNNDGKTLTFSVGNPVADARIVLVIMYTDGTYVAETGYTGSVSLTINNLSRTVSSVLVRPLSRPTMFSDTTTVIKDLQLELGEIATDFEEYKDAETYTPNPDGSVEVASVHPTMTLLTDTADTIIRCEYNRDTNSIAKSIPLVDRTTGMVYSLYISDGKVLIEERGV